jgi:hypothetical protein
MFENETSSRCASVNVIDTSSVTSVAGSPLFEIRSVMNAPTPWKTATPWTMPIFDARGRSEALAQRRQLWSVFALGESLTVRTFAFGGPLGAVLPSQMSDDHDRAPPSEQLGEIGRRRRVYDFSGFGRAAK